MASLEDFRRLIGGRAPTCPFPLLHDAIRQAAAEFCGRTRVWRERITAAYDENCTGYAPTLPGGAVIHEIESAWWGVDHDCPLTPMAFDDISPADLAEHGADTIPRVITQRASGVFRLVPRGTGTLTLNLILKPPSGALEGVEIILPDFLLHQHGEAIANGGLARALVMKDQAWSDPKGAAYALSVFERAAIAFSSYNTRGQQRAPRRAGFAWV